MLYIVGDIVFDSREDIKEKYYYAMYDMTVRGSCSCYGHASRCIPVDGYNNNPNMVWSTLICLLFVMKKKKQHENFVISLVLF